MFKKLISFLALLLVLTSLAAAQGGRPAELDAVVEQSLKAFGAPGVAVGVLRDGKVVLARGYGVRDTKRGVPVTVHTRFAIGSVTKSFTASIAAMLVDEGKLDWDRPVRDYLPWFRLHDRAATEMITARDMLTHRSGLPRHDFLRFAVPLEREELVRRLAWLEPTKPFRAAYQYNNLMYVTAGYLEGVLAGSTWEQLVSDRIFKPLGMAESNTSVLDSQKTDDYAKPYERRKGAVEEVDFYVYQKFGVGPNGAVNSSLQDMLKYLEFQMGDGKANGKQLVSAAQMREMHTPQFVAPSGGVPEFDLNCYGLAWGIGTYRNHKVIQHGGSIAGFRAWIGYFPAEKLGLVTLSNMGGNLPEALALTLADRLLGLEPIDWTKRMNRPEPERKLPPPQPGTHPSHPLKDFAGEYLHPAYGVARIEAQEDGLNMIFPARQIKLSHYHYDVFQGEGGWLVQFVMDRAGKIESVLLPVEPAARPLAFARKK